MMPPAGSLNGLRVLVVEDNILVSLMIEDTLSDQQCVIVGPYEWIGSALHAAQTEIIDLAILDINMRNEKVYPVAEVLGSRSIPFIFLSAYGQSAVPHTHPEWRVCSKPFTSKQLVSMLVEQLALAR